MSSRHHAEAAELRAESEQNGATPIMACVRGEAVTASGVLQSVTLRPRAGLPAVEADLYDGTGHLKIVWLGRRRIAGIEAGRALTIHGRMTCTDDIRTVFNPRYELRPRGET